MTNDAWTVRLSEYIDGELPASELSGLEQHLETCEACRETVALLRRVRMRAGALADRPPRADLWPGIANRIGVNTGSWVVQKKARRRWSFSMPQLAAAGIAMLLVGAGSTWLALRDEGAAVEGRVAIVEPVPIQPRFSGVAGYDAAIADLERVLAMYRNRLDTTTVRVLEESLTIIDRAIARARAALAADPGDVYLNTHLAETMRRKLALLRRAADIATAAS